MIVGNIKRIVRTKVLMILVNTKFIQSAKSANPDMAFFIFTECRNLLVGYIIRNKGTLPFRICKQVLLCFTARKQ